MTGAATVTASLDESGVLHVVLDKAPVNALADPEYRALFTAFAQAAPSGAKAVLLSARGRIFCAGGDLKERMALPEGADPDFELPLDLIRSIRDCPVPTLCAINGSAAGFGALMALATDVIVAAEDAAFLLPEINTGMVGGYVAAAAAMPRSFARFLAIGGAPQPAERLAEMGIIARLADPGRLQQEATALAAQVARHHADRRLAQWRRSPAH